MTKGDRAERESEGLIVPGKVETRTVRLVRRTTGKRPFADHHWTPARFAQELGLHRLVGTIRYPENTSAA